MYVYTQNITQGSAASGGADPASCKGFTSKIVGY